MGVITTSWFLRKWGREQRLVLRRTVMNHSNENMLFVRFAGMGHLVDDLLFERTARFGKV